MEIDDTEGNPVENSTKEEVEQACMEENEQQFRQANDTPFMKLPLIEANESRYNWLWDVHVEEYLGRTNVRL